MEISQKRTIIIKDMMKDNNSDISKYVNEFEKDVINSKYPGAYSSFEGSPMSFGKFQFDLWGKELI